MRIGIAAVGAALLALPWVAAAQTVTPDPLNRSITPAMRALPVHVGGRVVRTPIVGLPRGATAFTHEWPGVYWEAAFRGDAVVLKFDDPANEYRLLVDDRPPITLAQPGRAEIRITDLAAGRHRLRLEKVTESIGLVGRFDGFYVAKAARPLAVRPRRRQIEFIGPSGMTGYGNRSPKPVCNLEEVRLSTDTQQAFPALVARHYDADYQINAISGRGLIRNVDGSLPGYGLARVYPYALLDGTTPYADPDWRPQIIVTQMIADFIGDLKPGEAWKDSNALIADYLQAMTAFVAELHRRSPDAAIVLTWIDPATQTDPAVRQWLVEGRRQIENAAHRAGVRAIDFMMQPADLKVEMTGCNFHGNLRDQRIFADWTIGYLDKHREWWRGR